MAAAINPESKIPRKEITVSDYNYSEFDTMAERPNFVGFPANLHVGERAPGFALEDLDSGETVNLKDVWSTGVTVVEFGSFT
jgi:hypothetical protein